jgi:hypothetical protein
VRLWVSDKQDTFVSGIAAEFPGVPHRYCSNHFLRDLAKPTLAKDSQAKVQMRKKVRGLRDIERDVLRSVSQTVPSQGVEATTVDPLATAPTSPGRGSAEAAAVGWVAGGGAAVPDTGDSANQVVLDYCCAVRGILNDDQGGPLHPPGVRMAEARAEVRASLGRNSRVEQAATRPRAVGAVGAVCR